MNKKETNPVGSVAVDKQLVADIQAHYVAKKKRLLTKAIAVEIALREILRGK